MGPAVHTGYNPALVALSITIAVFASYTALDLASRVRSTVVRLRWPWIASAALVMGGGIWAMHFIGMLASVMGMSAAYHVGMTVLSLGIAVGFTAAAFSWVGRRNSKQADIWLGGLLMGVGVAAMHYTGMAAMLTPMNMAYSKPLVALSIAIAITAATAALWLSFRQHDVWQKLVAASVMGIAVAGMHYTGMAAATFTAGSQMAHAAPTGASQLDLALSVAAVTFVVLFAAILTSSLDQQRVQSELRKSEERFRAAVHAVRGVLWTNDAAGRMVGEQQGWAAITGQSQTEYEGLGWANAVHPDDVEATVEAWEETLREKRTFVFEHRLRSSDGGWRHYSIRAVPVIDERGTIREWVGVHTDITEQKEAEAELRASNEETQRFAYIVSHDLRSPLVNVLGFAGELEMVQADIKVALKDHPLCEQIDTDMGEALGFIKTSVQRMERLIAAILKISRDGRRAFRAEPLDMVSLIQGLADAQRHQCEAAGAVVSVSPDLPPIVADRLAVEQIFGNLIDNAVKYLDEGRPGLVQVSGRLMGQSACYEVADNGRGIETKDQVRIFELFRRAGRQDRPGEGIGLAHVMSLVRALGGDIKVFSEPSKGTRFTVSLPRSAKSRREYLSVATTAVE